VDVPGATPSNLVVALGKDGNAYLVNRENFGGISAPVASSHVANSAIIQAAVTYRTKQDTYVASHAEGTALSAFRITATNPPTIASAWSVSQGGRGSPFVTSTDGANNMIVWVVGADVGGDQRLHGFDGETGNLVYAGGGPNELMAGTRRFNTGIAARGRIYIANDNKVYAFVTPTPGSITLSAHGRRVQRRHTVDLSWTGSDAANIDIFRDGVAIATVPNTGAYKDFIGVRGGNARYTYKVCEAATQNCSNEVTVRFGGPPL